MNCEAALLESRFGAEIVRFVPSMVTVDSNPWLWRAILRMFVPGNGGKTKNPDVMLINVGIEATLCASSAVS